jgi:FlaA1/EpsC-like NDP-sugar epimerase
MAAIWITGASGSVGSALLERHPQATGTDIDVDVTDRTQVQRFLRTVRPDVIFHCAGAKHAPEGEADPAHVAKVNIDGTKHVLESDARVVLASTCKAADPETAYGASKLIAERMTLNAGGTVARFFNVKETSGNVFQIWRNTPAPEPIRAMPCWRYFIGLAQAVELMDECSRLPTGRYSVNPGEAVWIPDLARSLYPDREIVTVPPRRGDRIREPLRALSETVKEYRGLLKVSSPHDC